MYSMALASGTVFSELAFDLHANHQFRALGLDSVSFITLRACAFETMRGCSISSQTGLRYGTLLLQSVVELQISQPLWDPP